MTLIICFLISLLLAGFVLVKPLFLDAVSAYETVESNQPDFDPSIAILETIAELETDYNMGKLTQADYEKLSLEYKRQYLALKEPDSSRQS